MVDRASTESPHVLARRVAGILAESRALGWCPRCLASGLDVPAAAVLRVTGRAAEATGLEQLDWWCGICFRRGPMLMLSEARTRRPRRARVLIVDDDDDTRAVLGAFLAYHGYEMETAAHAGDALMIIEHDRPALILLDILMPGMDGLQMLRRLRAKDAALPVIVVSAVGEADTIRKARRLGVYDYLVKPLDLVRLERLIAEALAPTQRPAVG